VRTSRRSLGGRRSRAPSDVCDVRRPYLVSRTTSRSEAVGILLGFGWPTRPASGIQPLDAHESHQSAARAAIHHVVPLQPDLHLAAAVRMGGRVYSSSISRMIARSSSGIAPPGSTPSSDAATAARTADASRADYPCTPWPASGSDSATRPRDKKSRSMVSSRSSGAASPSALRRSWTSRRERRASPLHQLPLPRVDLHRVDPEPLRQRWHRLVSRRAPAHLRLEIGYVLRPLRLHRLLSRWERHFFFSLTSVRILGSTSLV